MKSPDKKPSQKCSIVCNLCDDDNVEEIGNTDRNGDYLRSVICTNCGLSWSDPRPNEDEIKKFYSKDYRISYKGTYTPKFKHIYRAGKVALHRHTFIKNILNKDDAILDVGAGGGEFVYLMNKLGFDARGIEPNEGYGNYARDDLDLPIQIGFVQQADLPNDFYNVITMHHVLEHLDDPFSALEKINRSLQNKGFLVVEVPNIESVCSAPISRFHVAHLYNFNRQNLEAMGQLTGFSIYKTVISPDGGVITTIFQKTDESDTNKNQISGNYDKISLVVKKHTQISHLLTLNPYVRPIKKLLRYFDEAKTIKNCTNVKEVLGNVFQNIAP